MHLHDDIYGDIEIPEPIFEELIASKSVQRLKGIAQQGLPDRYYHLEGYTRFEHSVGVMLLLRRLGASEEEQIAGLLHDVSHTAFSHVVDWVIGDRMEETFQDLHHDHFLKSSELPAILLRYGYNVDAIADCHRFSILEQERPHLCADRIDYSLREFPFDVAVSIIPHLRVADGKIVCANHETALALGTNYNALCRDHWAGFDSINRYHLLGHALRHALDREYMTIDDFWTDDETVVAKLVVQDDPCINKILTALSQKSLLALPRSTDIQHIKFWSIDPEYYEGDALVRLSEADHMYAELLHQTYTQHLRGTPLVDINRL